MATDKDSSLYNISRMLLTDGISQRSTESLACGIRSLLRCLDWKSAINVASAGLGAVGLVFVREVTTVEWVRQLAVALPDMHAKLLSHVLENPEFDLDRYYSPIEGYVWAVRDALRAALAAELNPTSRTDDLAVAVAGAIESLVDLPRVMGAPERYAVSRAFEAWADRSEGPSPTPPDVPVEDEGDDFAPVAGVVEAMLALNQA